MYEKIKCINTNCKRYGKSLRCYSNQYDLCKDFPRTDWTEPITQQVMDRVKATSKLEHLELPDVQLEIFRRSQR